MDVAGCSRMQSDFVGDFFPNVGDLSLMLVTFLAFLIRSFQFQKELVSRQLVFLLIY